MKQRKNLKINDKMKQGERKRVLYPKVDQIHKSVIE